MALPGGSVAETFFPRLATLSLDRNRTEFFWVDERAVPPTHTDSNYRLAHSLWLGPAGVPAERMHRMVAEDPDLARAASMYSDELTHLVGSGPPRLDVVLLGVGPDGHVASLFPGHPAVREELRPVAPIYDAPKPPPRRLTMTLPALAGARRLIVVAVGESKAVVLRDALEQPDSSLPIAIATRRASRPLWLLDETAGRLVRAPR